MYYEIKAAAAFLQMLKKRNEQNNKINGKY